MSNDILHIQCALPNDSQRGEGEVFAAVILHYISLDLTFKCIDSLRKLSLGNSKMKIVVIDNASPNGSGLELANAFQGNEDVQVLLNEENVGFSRANNIGYLYAVRQWHPEAILVLNNDIVIEQADFMVNLQGHMRNDSVHVIAPDVYAPRKKAHQSPLRDHALSEAEIEADLRYYRSVLDGSEARSLKGRIKALPIVQSLLKVRSGRRRRRKNKIAAIAQNNVVPSGAALIFTRSFIETGEMPFRPETFLYYEEDILLLRCLRNGWRIRYIPDLQVLHFHEGSTSEVAPSDEEKRLFIAKHYLDSLKVLLEYESEGEPGIAESRIGISRSGGTS